MQLKSTTPLTLDKILLIDPKNPDFPFEGQGFLMPLIFIMLSTRRKSNLN